MKLSPMLILIVACGLGCNRDSVPSGQSGVADWRSDWAVKPGFSLTEDTQGYDFPTAIAFVPQPGPNPKDPLYFVTEIRGKIKVVTNDRTVYTFAENFFSLRPPQELPAHSGEIGLAGVCLAPGEGAGFVSLFFPGSPRSLPNKIIRFQSRPKTFTLRPLSQQAFTEIFSQDISATSHQIGPCQVRDGSLFV